MSSELNTEELNRYDRHLKLEHFGIESQLKLKKAKVVVVGAGGLGCPVLQYLCAAGVGTIGIIDNDQVSLSNLQRQILFTTEDIGKQKSQIAVQKLKALNPNCKLMDFNVRLNTENALEIIQQFDLVIDGSDNFSTRYLVNDACVILKKPLVFGSIYKYEGQLSVFNYKSGPTYRCLFPEPPEDGEMLSCSEIGVLGVLPGLIGSMMANEAIKIITGIGDVLSGQLLIWDSLTAAFSSHRFFLNPKNQSIFELSTNEIYCEMNVNEISVEELKKLIQEKKDFQLIDVREAWEYDEKNIGAQHLSLYEIPEKLDLISKTKQVILHCQSGNRSTTAAKLLMDKGYSNVLSLKGGINAFLQE